MTNLDSVLKSRNINFACKGPYSQSYGLPSSHIWMCELDYKEVWVPKNWCFWTVVLEKTLESPLDCKEIKPVNPKGNQPWIFIWSTDAEAPVLWTPDVKSQLIGKDPDAGKDWQQVEKGTMVGWHHRLDGHEFEQASGVGDGQGNLACCSQWGRKESDTTERLNMSDSCWPHGLQHTRLLCSALPPRVWENLKLLHSKWNLPKKTIYWMGDLCKVYDI